MNSIRFPGITFVFFILLLLFFSASLIYLHYDLLPTVFSDEWIYSSSSRLMHLTESVTPSYLFLSIFKNTNFCGMHFLNCARTANAFFYACSFPFIYFIVKKVTNPLLAFYIAILVMLAPTHSYTAYFMPESMYFLSFSILAWFVLNCQEINVFLYTCCIGVFLALMSLIKVHALFLIPGLISFFLLCKGKKSWLIIFNVCLIFVITRLLLGYFFAGEHGLDLIGQKYHDNFTAIFIIHRWEQILKQLSVPLLGHLSALALIFGLPIVILMNTFRQNNITTFTLTCFIPVFLITIFTTAQIVAWDDYEIINRIHMRYYNFFFPLFLLPLCYVTPNHLSVKKKWLMSILMIELIFFGFLFLDQYKLSYVDCPELFGFRYSYFYFKWFVCMQIACILLWHWNEKFSKIAYLILYTGIVIVASYYVNLELHRERYFLTDAYDEAGMFTKQLLEKESGNLVVIGSERAGLFKTLFYIDNPRTSIVQWPEHIPIELAKMPVNKKWILIIGQYPVLRKPLLRIKRENFSILKML